MHFAQQQDDTLVFFPVFLSSSIDNVSFTALVFSAGGTPGASCHLYFLKE
jgi:hypothetical protein